MAERVNGHRLDIHDPHWDPRDKLAYLQDLRDHGVPAMRENRGKLLDMHGTDRSDLIPEPGEEGLAPFIGERMAMVQKAIDTLIEETHTRFVEELTRTEGTRAGNINPIP